MIVIGVTGSLASGKSEVARIFKSLGGRVFDADAAARKALAKGRPAHKAVVKLFGKGFLARGGELDRRKLAGHVFSHPPDLRRLNILIHPGVIFECFGMIERSRRKKGFLVLDVPLLFESHMENLADFTVVVQSPRRSMLRRAERRGIPGKLARKILSTQWPLKRKARLADFVIHNNKGLTELRRQVVAVAARIRSAHQERSRGFYR